MPIAKRARPVDFNSQVELSPSSTIVVNDQASLSLDNGVAAELPGDDLTLSEAPKSPMAAGAADVPLSLSSTASSSSNRAKFQNLASAPAAPVAPPVLLPSSPGNRDRFRQSLMPLQMTCDLSSASTDPGMRF